MLSEGLQIAQYRIIRQLRRGGMGEVYQAEDTTLERQVAIKVIRADTLREAGPRAARKAADLFLREARIIARLEHEHILPIFDVGEELINGVTCMYMVMPFRYEGSFADWLQKRGEDALLSLWEVEHIVQQAAQALQNAHNRQIIHQDVKPANFLIQGEAEDASQLKLQLADFGVAKFMTTTDETETIRGTPFYMAPEQWQGNAVAATDQYALAVMAYELLTGRPPFIGQYSQQIGYQHCNVAPVPPSSLNPNIPPEIDDVLLRALAKKPTERFGSIAIFARAFRQALLHSGNIHYTLSISAAEARTGTRRVVTLPGGRRVPVVVPPGVHNGQLIRLEGQGAPSSSGGPRGALIVTLAIARQNETRMFINASTIERTAPIRPPYEEHDDDHPPHDNRHRRRITGAIRAVLALLLLAISMVAVLGTWIQHQQQQDFAQETATTALNKTQTTLTQTAASITNSDATATTTAQNGSIKATIIADNATTIAGNATATAITKNDATATVVAGNATATATAKDVTATQVALNITATVTAYDAIFSPGTPAMNDPLRDNSMGYQWDETGSCQFTGGAYHAISTTPGRAMCFAQLTKLSNFNCQIEMKFTKGDQGGIVLRANQTNGTFYYLHMGADHSYALEMYNHGILTGVLKDGTTSVIQTNPNQANLIGLVANGSTLDVYVNRTLLIDISDSTYTAGQIGVVAEDVNNPTDIAFSNIEVHTLP